MKIPPKTAADFEFAAMKKIMRDLPVGEGGPGLALGDKLHSLFGPIGKAIHWPCLKGDGTTDLKPASWCNYFRITLNKL